MNNTTETSTNTVLISTRSRNLSCGWENKPIQTYNENGSSDLGFKTPNAPREQGGVATLRRQLAECEQVNSGNYSRKEFFVGGKRVVNSDSVNQWLEFSLGFGINELLVEIDA